jgi:hypothetical protein
MQVERELNDTVSFSPSFSLRWASVRVVKEKRRLAYAMTPFLILMWDDRKLGIA